jgi:excisionase family DNA binding protein
MSARAEQNWLEQLIRTVARETVMEMQRQAQAESSLPRPRLLTVKEAAKYLARSPWTIYALAKKGKLRTVKIDGVVCFDIADLDAAIEAGKGYGKCADQ